MKIINVVSGKGGTGKTLVTAVLAELLSKRGRAKVLVIDLDIFVRGLTCLLYFEGDKRRRLINDDQVSVSEIISGEKLGGGNPGVEKYRSFDVWPSVHRIDQKMMFEDIMPNNFAEALRRLSYMLDRITKDYDIIFIDSRAGYDELIAATHKVSDITINVEEDDLVSRITSDNLTAQLEEAARTPVYRIINKSLGKHAERIGDLGRIPFDADVMRTYGEEDFWINITRSLLEPALVQIWNNLARNENVDIVLTSTRTSPLPSEQIENTLSRITLMQRIYAVYGGLIGIAGVILSLGGKSIIVEFSDDPFRLIGLIMTLIGLVLAYLAIGNFASKGKV